MSEQRPNNDKLRQRFSETATSGVRQRLEQRAALQPDVEIQPSTRRTDSLSIKADLQQRVFDELSRNEMLQASDEAVRAEVERFVGRILSEEGLPLNASERRRLAGELAEETLGVGPLASLMADPAVTDILVNAPDRVFVERFGRLEQTDVRFRDDEHIHRVIERIAGRLGRRIDRNAPMVDLRLSDGSRVNATIPPVSPDGPTISIRRFGRRRLMRDDLLQLKMLSPAMDEFLQLAVRGRCNLVVSGGTGAGKSTLLGSMCEAIPTRERVVTIEDTMELMLEHEHWVRLETRPANVEGEGLITPYEVLVNTLRMRPDRIILGEVRGSETIVMLQAMNTGHEGGMSTVHANSPREALSRLEVMVLMGGIDMPVRAIRDQIVSALDLIVHVRRYEDGVRRVESVAELVGMEGDVPLSNEIFRFERQGGGAGGVKGEFRPTGIRPRIAEKLIARGLDVPPELFH